jgi:hypothetical protein
MTTRHRITPTAISRVAEPPDGAALVAGLVTVTLWGSAFVGIRAADETLTPGAIALRSPGRAGAGAGNGR